MIVYAYHPSPVGPLLLVGHPQPDGQTAITRVLMQDQKHGVPVGADWAEDPAAFTDAARQLDEYFAGERRTFDLPLDPAGTAVPARGLGAAADRSRSARPRPTATSPRASASRRHRGRWAPRSAATRSAIIVPCHRVVGSSGALTGYAGGMDRKIALLTLEGALRV